MTYILLNYYYFNKNDIKIKKTSFSWQENINLKFELLNQYFLLLLHVHFTKIWKDKNTFIFH